ncbi:gliding motility-associated C-terminal domain-containing protein [Pontibacter cellulosilyticus]|uniref:Gliding motility-associated C-terminal domain-containing protein n=1 Tax=Pontibacter cellulosilyticus TaxID=1720253 RepID=A0A923N3V0_9BACT|nr:gliding motility-associated C-terminal domain-containing protein [Pontibacter cellulosilyticus]MBC5991379.1 gliding motility-associated C-terminal domain-containing protein [Pontibacter cellulosilyticus]
MKLRLLLLAFAFLICANTYATHIVGGEFELKHIINYNYRLTLNLYFDDVNGSPGALDQTVTVNFFEKGTNRLMLTQVMPFRSRTPVNYTNIECTVASLKTSKIVYFENIFLDPNRFNSPAGYYVTWERCCRNRTINNILQPENAAQTFYMEFPPVVKNGVAFRNSSPILFPPLSDYACVNELFYFDFNGTDPDGDSIVYDMVTPLNGYTTPGMPVYTTTPKPEPYPPVNWLPGYSTTVQVQGSPPMNINRQTGQLTMRPSQKGLFVFGIRAQEFRNGQKIGEVRRDFQVLVLDCPKNQTPVVTAREQGKTTNYNQGEVLRIGANGNRCIDVLFTDPDIQEFVELRARPVNFSNQNFTLQGVTSGTINQGTTTNQTLKATLCFDECFDTEGKVYQMDLIVRDDGCSLPRQDTVRLSFVIEPIPNVPPTVSLSTTQRVFNVKNGDILTFDALGFDADNDNITITAAGQNFNLNTQNITFQQKTAAGQVSSPFRWAIDCKALQESYKIDFTVNTTVCGKTVSRTETIEVRPDNINNVPTLTTDKQVRVFNLVAGEPFEAKLFGNDIDMNGLALQAAGQGFNLADLGMTFSSTGGQGTAEGTFKWVANCTKEPESIRRVTFTLKETACAPSPDQQMVFEFRITAPNNAPTFTTDKNVLVFDLGLNEPFEAKLFGRDIDLNSLTMNASGEGFTLEELGMAFKATNGNGTADGTFTWTANCLGAEKGVVRVTFNLNEQACQPAPDQQITMEFRVKVPVISDYVPANIFTPNGDGLNDFFEIPALPTDFCTAQFASIKIFNRWGKEVYVSTSNTFKWDGKGVNDGVYFYVIDYKTTTYKGSVTLVR